MLSAITYLLTALFVFSGLYLVFVPIFNAQSATASESIYRRELNEYLQAKRLDTEAINILDIQKLGANHISTDDVQISSDDDFVYIQIHYHFMNLIANKFNSHSDLRKLRVFDYIIDKVNE